MDHFPSSKDILSKTPLKLKPLDSKPVDRKPVEARLKKPPPLIRTYPFKPKTV